MSIGPLVIISLQGYCLQNILGIIWESR